MSTNSSPFVVRWGIIGCGMISGSFCKDIALQRDDVQDVKHSIVAVGSRDVKKAEDFINDNCPNGGTAQQSGHESSKPTAVGSYDEVCSNPDVDCVYIGTPHNLHYQNAKQVLEAGKPCLLEKPATLNEREWDDLVRIAKEKKVFLMEAVWTRFQPLMVKLMDLVHNEKLIGDVKSVYSDFSLHGKLPLTHRLYNPDLAGGSLLDGGPYALLPGLLFLYNAPENNRTPPAKITSSMLKAETGVDSYTTIIMDFPNLGAKAIGNGSLNYNSMSGSCIKICGTKGTIEAGPMPPRPTKATITTKIDTNAGFWVKNNDKVEHLDMDFPGQGLYFEADEVARCLRDGKVESEKMTWADTSMTMQIFDTVRKQGEYYLPEGMESFPLQ